VPSSCCVVDTNVALVANGAADASPDCILTCTRRLLEITREGCIAIDDEWRIIREYQRKLSPSGQPGPGDAFLKWVLNHQGNPQRCRRVKLNPRLGKGEDFEEFPSHSALAEFDPADRKFVAVAVACQGGPIPILQAVDSKWWGWAEALRECQVEVEFLCPAEIAAKYQEKLAR
jgi:hypothetical protein